MTDHEKLTHEQLMEHAREAFRSSDVAGAAAYASFASVELLEQFMTLARDGIQYEWKRVELPGGDTFTCSCGQQAFTEYPTATDLPYIICATPDCPSVWDLGTEDDGLERPRRVTPFGGAAPESPWERNNLVRYRSPSESGVHYVALLQSRDENSPGWWHAMVLKTVSSNDEPRMIVGQSIRLKEGSPYSTVARFLD